MKYKGPEGKVHNSARCRHASRCSDWLWGWWGVETLLSTVCIQRLFAFLPKDGSKETLYFHSQKSLWWEEGQGTALDSTPKD